MADTRKSALAFGLAVALRVAVAVVGAYFAAAGLATLAAVALPHLTGLSRSDAVVLSASVGFLVYLALALWAVATPQIGRTGAILALLAIGGYAIAQSLAQTGA